MFNRFKLLVLAIIIVVLTTLFLQNQEPLSLKFFCPDIESEYCLYQTPTISLAVWMAISILSGIFLSLVWQLLNRANSSSKRRNYFSRDSSRISASHSNRSYGEQSRLRKESDSINPRESNSNNPNKFKVSDWEQSKSDNWEATNLPNFAKNREIPDTNLGTGSQDTNDSKQYPKNSQSNLRTAWANESPPEPSSKEMGNSDNTKIPSAQNRQEIYDANYRTLNNVPPPSSSEKTSTEEEDPDWI